jgi:hypothetical protein
MKHAWFTLFIPLLVNVAVPQLGFAQAGTWRSTITGVNLPQSAGRIADSKIVSAASRMLETVAAQNALNGRCRGTEVVQSTQTKSPSIVDSLETGLSARGYSLENLPGGEDARYSLAARRGGSLIVVNVNALGNSHVVVAWCSLEPVAQTVQAPESKTAVPLGKYVCSYTLPNGSLVRAGTITVISSSTYRWNTDSTLHQYAYAAPRLTWLSGPFSDTKTYLFARYVPSRAGRPRFSLTERAPSGMLPWTCEISR